MKHYEKICVKFYLFSRHDREDLNVLAKSAGMAVGTYVRCLVLEASKRRREEKAARRNGGVRPEAKGNGEAA